MSLSCLLASLRRISPRTWVRTGFLGVFLLSCWQLWHYYQWALGAEPFVQRPEATAGLVPLGALFSLSAWVKSGVFDQVMPAAMVIVLAAFALSILLKRGYCGWVCPVGTTVSAIAWLGRRFSGGQPRPVNKRLDIALHIPKYLVTVLLLGWIITLPAQVGLDFQNLPYYATGDIKILYGLLHPAWGYWVIFGFVTGTTLIVGTNTWCRYLCPLGTVYGGVSAASLGTVKRNIRYCTDCKVCDKACVAHIKVSTSTRSIRDPECDGCQDCIRACPVSNALNARIGGMRIPWQFWPLLVLTAWLLIWTLAVKTGHWQHGLPDSTIAKYMRSMKLTHDF